MDKLKVICKFQETDAHVPYRPHWESTATYRPHWEVALRAISGEDTVAKTRLKK